MQSKLSPLAGHQRFSDRDPDARLCIYLWIYCVLVVGCFALGLYELMQPVRYPNVGLSGYPSSATAYTLPPSSSTEGFAVAIEPDEKTKGGTAPSPDQAKKSDHPRTNSKRTRPVPRTAHDPRMDYAAQPARGSYRPWGAQSWNNQPWGNQSWNNRPWGTQIWNNNRTWH